MIVVPISSQKLSYGFTPYWDVKSQSLYFVDYVGKLVCRYDYAQKRVYCATLEGDAINPTFFLPMAGCKHEFAVSNDRRVVVVRFYFHFHTNK